MKQNTWSISRVEQAGIVSWKQFDFAVNESVKLNPQTGMAIPVCGWRAVVAGIDPTVATYL